MKISDDTCWWSVPDYLCQILTTSGQMFQEFVELRAQEICSFYKKDKVERYFNNLLYKNLENSRALFLGLMRVQTTKVTWPIMQYFQLEILFYMYRKKLLEVLQ